MNRARGTLGEVIDRLQASERRLAAPEVDPTRNLLLALLIAIDNVERARLRCVAAHVVGALEAAMNLRGAQRNLDAAKTAAQEFLAQEL